MWVVQGYLSLIYFGMKFFFLAAIVSSLVKFEPLQRHVFFLSVLYTGAVAFLSYVFLISPGDAIYWKSWRDWQVWLGITFVLSLIYFKLLVRFDEGILFWVVLLLGVALVAYY
jgi:hypothetical protein